MCRNEEDQSLTPGTLSSLRVQGEEEELLKEKLEKEGSVKEKKNQERIASRRVERE